ncbi:peptidylprolyl isomerase [Candidatus Woesearchaeota archaeon]|nr:peptidylprolyl isomerase [Candidatus Woesearchaeota archaeon]MBW3022252.1 peptidylprolyl isomerase [Candidatus Woesearchaeota archaeon]
MATIKKKDFVEVEYIGRLKDNNALFDTTDKDLATKENVFNPRMEYGPVIICIGEGHILKAIDEFLEGKELDKEYALALEPEQAFGKKNAKLLKIIPASIFKKQKINPVPGLQVNIDGVYGIIKTVTGGRTIVDFNHPLAGRGVIYTLKALRIITDTKEKAQSLLKMLLNLSNIDLELENNTLRINVNKEAPVEIQSRLNEKITALIPEIKKVEYVLKSLEKKPEAKE